MNTMHFPIRMAIKAAVLLAILLAAPLRAIPPVGAATIPVPSSSEGEFEVRTRQQQEAALRAGHELFAKGMDLHAKDRAGAQSLFANAAAAWRALALHAPIHNAKLELNIANASLLAGEPARAIAAFRRAQLLDPSNVVVEGGLAAARRAAGTQALAPDAAALVAEPGEGGFAGTARGIGRFLADAADRTVRWFPVKLVIAAAACCYIATFALGIAAALRWRRVRPRHAFAAGLICLLVAGPAIAIEAASVGVRDAVVIQDGVIARSGPAEMYDAAFKEPLRPGVECRVLEMRPQWLLLRLWDGRRAWVPSGAVEFITR